jgi:hypothetical protein
VSERFGRWMTLHPAGNCNAAEDMLRATAKYYEGR